MNIILKNPNTKHCFDTTWKGIVQCFLDIVHINNFDIYRQRFHIGIENVQYT